MKISFDLAPEGGASIGFWLEVDELKAFMKTDIYKELLERYEISREGLYADNSLYAAKLSIAVKGTEWSEFENGQLFHDLKSYLEAVYDERRDKQAAYREEKCESENRQSSGHCNSPECRTPLWALICKLFHRISGC